MVAYTSGPSCSVFRVAYFIAVDFGGRVEMERMATALPISEGWIVTKFFTLVWCESNRFLKSEEVRGENGVRPDATVVGNNCSGDFARCDRDRNFVDLLQKNIGSILLRNWLRRRSTRIGMVRHLDGRYVSGITAVVSY